MKIETLTNKGPSQLLEEFANSQHKLGDIAIVIWACHLAKHPGKEKEVTLQVVGEKLVGSEYINASILAASMLTFVLTGGSHKKKDSSKEEPLAE